MSGRSESRSETPRSEQQEQHHLQQEPKDDKSDEHNQLANENNDSKDQQPSWAESGQDSQNKSGWGQMPVSQEGQGTNWEVRVSQGGSGWDTGAPPSDNSAPPSWGNPPQNGTALWDQQQRNPNQMNQPASQPQRGQNKPMPNASWGTAPVTPSHAQPSQSQNQPPNGWNQPTFGGQQSSISQPSSNQRSASWGIGAPGPAADPRGTGASNWGGQSHSPNQAQPVSSPQPVQPNNWGAGDNNQSSASWGQPAAPSSNPPQGAAQTQWNTHPQSTAGAGWGGSEAPRDQAVDGIPVISSGDSRYNYSEYKSIYTSLDNGLDEATSKIINCNEGWGTKKISQTTKWTVDESPEPNRRRVPSQSNGTEFWEKGGGGANITGPPMHASSQPGPNPRQGGGQGGRNFEGPKPWDQPGPNSHPPSNWEPPPQPVRINADQQGSGLKDSWQPPSDSGNHWNPPQGGGGGGGNPNYSGGHPRGGGNSGGPNWGNQGGPGSGGPPNFPSRYGQPPVGQFPNNQNYPPPSHSHWNPHDKGGDPQGSSWNSGHGGNSGGGGNGSWNPPNMGAGGNQWGPRGQSSPPRNQWLPKDGGHPDRPGGHIDPWDQNPGGGPGWDRPGQNRPMPDWNDKEPGWDHPGGQGQSSWNPDWKDSNSMDQRRPGGMGIPGPGFAPPNMAMSNIPYIQKAAHHGFIPGHLINDPSLLMNHNFAKVGHLCKELVTTVDRRNNLHLQLQSVISSRVSQNYSHTYQNQVERLQHQITQCTSNEHNLRSQLNSIIRNIRVEPGRRPYPPGPPPPMPDNLRKSEWGRPDDDKKDHDVDGLGSNLDNMGIGGDPDIRPTDTFPKGIGPPEFQPGVPWKGYKASEIDLDPEKNPELTPAIYQQKKQEQEQNQQKRGGWNQYEQPSSGQNIWGNQQSQSSNWNNHPQPNAQPWDLKG